MKNITINAQPNFDKSDGLVPAIIQDAQTGVVLMLGYMNQASWEKTLELGKVTFFSRSKQRLWTKGESSGNFLLLEDALLDCDQDTFLLKVTPVGPACHKGTDTCFEEENRDKNFLDELEQIIHSRKTADNGSSYTRSLLDKGINKVAQKVGEEAVELVIEAKDDNDDLFLGEAADLMYHYLVLLAAKDIRLSQVLDTLKDRHKK